MACSDTLCQYQSLTNRSEIALPIPSTFLHNSLTIPSELPQQFPQQFPRNSIKNHREAFFEIPSKFPPRSPQSHFLQNPSASPSKIQHTSLTIPTTFHQNSIKTPSTSHQHTNKHLSIPANVLHNCTSPSTSSQNHLNFPLNFRQDSRTIP